jgi:tetratricopeptide (TPR) repeat protein
MALRQDDPLSAFNYAKEALKINSKDGEAAAIAAVALARLDRVKDAAAYFEMAISERPSRDTLWNYAVFSFSQGDYRRALRLINRIEANYKIDPDVIMLKAQCYEYLAKTPQAITEYRTILSAGSNVPQEMADFAQLRLKALTGSEYVSE